MKRTPTIEVPAHVFVPGYFMEPVYAWMPWYVPVGLGPSTLALRESASARRARQVELGNSGSMRTALSNRTSIDQDASKALVNRGRR